MSNSSFAAASAQNISRRSLVAGGAAAAATVAAVGAAGNALASESSSSVEEITGQGFDRSADLVIVGAGFGGLCAGLQALDDGVENVTIVEISKWVGGGTAFSEGSIHTGITATNEDEYNAATGYLNVNNPIGYKAYSSIADLLSWLGEKDLPFSNDSTEVPHASMLDADGNVSLDGPHYFCDAVAERFSEAGGTILTETGASEILTDELGNVSGVRCTTSAGETLTIATTQVILACGGFQNDAELKQRYMGGEHVEVMGTPYNTGAGIKMAAKLGATLAGDMNRWAGLYVLSAPVKNWMADPDAYEEYDFSSDTYGKQWMFANCIMLIPAYGLILNGQGQRVPSGLELVREREGVGLVVLDADGWDEWMGEISFTYDTFGDQYEQHLTSEEVRRHLLRGRHARRPVRRNERFRHRHPRDRRGCCQVDNRGVQRDRRAPDRQRPVPLRANEPGDFLQLRRTCHKRQGSGSRCSPPAHRRRLRCLPHRRRHHGGRPLLWRHRPRGRDRTLGSRLRRRGART